MADAQFSFSEESRRRLTRWAVLIGILLLILAFGSSLLRMQADYWWYLYDAKAPVVFSTALRTRIILFLIGFVIATPLLIWNVQTALNASMVFGRLPQTPAEAMITSMMSWTQHKGRRLIFLVAPILGVLFGLSLAAFWESWLLYQNSIPFGQADPIFGKDYSFYVFQLPFFKAVAAWLLGLALLNLFAALVIYYGVRAMAALARMPLTVPAVRTHLSILGVVLLVLVGATIWFQRYDATTVPGGRFMGAGYADLQALGAKTITCFILWLTALGTLINLRMWRPYVALITGAILAGVMYFFGGIVWPNAVQSYKVTPNEFDLQAPYISRGIAATRWAYNLGKINLVEFPVEIQPTKEAMQEAQVTLENMRLWDPDVLRLSVDNLQSLRDYYGFQDIDVDRYVISGKQRMLMLGARDLVIDPSRTNWQNLRLQFTHGNGVVAVPVNEADVNGRPKYLLSDIPPRGAPELAVKEPRLYYADSVDETGQPVDRYVLVRSKQPEFDYNQDAQTHWDYDGGIPIGGAWAKTVYAFVFGDKDILFSGDITNETRLLYRRSVRDRASKIFPYIRWDNDPYITIVGGALVWILDGYTTTDAIPYSDAVTVGATDLNYVRNSVKLTINAYSGEWKAYLTDTEDPIIKVYNKIYPGLLRPVSEAPEEIKKHFRYPEDMFSLQSHELATYHVTDPRIFFRRSDAWQIPEQNAQHEGAARIKPYFVQMRLPNEPKDGFVLILPFSPVGRTNMIGWLAAHCDQEDYGKLTLYHFPPSKNIDGPAQEEARFQTDSNLSQRITLLNQRGSLLVNGNLLVVPIGQSVMYVKTFFLQAVAQKPQPELKLVVLAFSNKIVFAETYDAALQLLMGGAAPKMPTGITRTEGVLPSDVARRALELLDAGKAALKAGDWARYGETQKQLEDLLRKAIK